MARLRREEVVTIQVLREKEVPQREIARQLGVSEGTVRYHLRRSVERAQDGRQGQPQRAASLEPVIEAFRERHESSCTRPLNARELYEFLVAEHGYSGSYKSVLRYVRRRYGAAPIRTYRRVETPPGAQSQTDWGEFPAVDLGDGPEPLHAFVMVLSHSRKPAIVWSRSEDQVSWLWCHTESYRRHDGVAAVNRIDNVKTAVATGAGSWGTIHPTYRAYARAMRFHVDPCPPRAPEAKGKAEAKVRLSRLLTPVLSCRYDGGLGELQDATDDRIERWARKAICPVTGKTVQESWEEEREFLGRLPDPLPEPFDVCVKRPVHRDCTVHFEGRQYPVPFVHVGRHLEVRGCAGKVQIVDADQVVREYRRHTVERILVDPTCYEGESTDHRIAPPPLGKMGRRLQELYEMPVEQRPLDLYAALAEVAR